MRKRRSKTSNIKRTQFLDNKVHCASAVWSVDCISEFFANDFAIILLSMYIKLLTTESHINKLLIICHRLHVLNKLRTKLLREYTA